MNSVIIVYSLFCVFLLIMFITTAFVLKYNFPEQKPFRIFLPYIVFVVLFLLVIIILEFSKAN